MKAYLLTKKQDNDPIAFGKKHFSAFSPAGYYGISPAPDRIYTVISRHADGREHLYPPSKFMNLTISDFL